MVSTVLLSTTIFNDTLTEMYVVIFHVICRLTSDVVPSDWEKECQISNSDNSSNGKLVD